jgi:Family of unknown function (DUF6270)
MAETHLSPEPSPRKFRITSLGGCITNTISEWAESFTIERSRHLWRRPTIALMSKPPQSAPVLDDAFPPDFAGYWLDDFSKHHRDEAFGSDGDILVFDITRDIFCTVLELEDFCYVLDPMSVKDLMWYGDSLSHEIINAAIGKAPRRINSLDAGYFEIWKYYFDAFVKSARRFDKLILNKLYFTNRLALQEHAQFGDIVYVEKVNAFLDNAYEYIEKTYDNIHINSISRHFMMSGAEVPWGGPTHTHYISEAIALLSENLRSIIMGPTYMKGTIFFDKAIDRAKKHEDILRQFHGVCAERDRLAASNEESMAEKERFAARLAEAELHRDQFAAERDHRLSELQQATEENNALRSQLAAFELQRDGLIAVREELASALQRVIGEKEAFQSQLAQAERQRDGLIADREELASGLERAIAEKEAFQSRLAQAELQRDGLIADRDDLSEQLQARRNVFSLLTKLRSTELPAQIGISRSK